MFMALFTIEQIELIRRLRSSGITKDQVLLAFNELERLDAEFNRSLSYEDQFFNQNFEFSYDSVSPGAVPNGTTSLVSNNVTPALSRGFTSQNVSDCLQFTCKPEYYGVQNSHTPCNSTNSSDGISDSDAHNSDCSAHALNVPCKQQNDLPVLSIANDAIQNSCGSDNLSQTSYRSMNGSLFSLEVQNEDHVELQELKKKGDMAILNEIRNFVMAYNIKQTLIAEMTKMSQPYVSRFFRGDIQDMPERTKDVFFMWYLTCKNNPLKLAQMCPNSGVKRMLSESGDLIPLKRERFTFKGAHLAVLEKYYEQDPYPDTHVREMIVEECNKAAESSEWPLSEKDTVTLPVVNNWFNNRRKDAKKQLKLRHNSPSAVIPCQVAGHSPLVPVTSWSSCSMSSFSIYHDLSTEISESDSSSTSDRNMDSDHNLIIDIQEHEVCDVKQML